MLSASDRYVAIATNFLTLLVTARLMTPSEIGIAVLGLSVLGLADIVRDFGGTAYLVQVDHPTPARVRSVFTFSLALTLLLGGLLFAFSGPIAGFYGHDGLVDYLRLTSICFAFGPIMTPVYALLRRELAFGVIATVNIAAALVNALVTVTLAYHGHGYMSFAWGTLVSGALSTVLFLWWRPDFSVFRISISEWRHVCAYAFYDSLKNILYYCQDALPLMVLGHTAGAQALGLYHRGLMIARLPERFLLAGLPSALLPTFAQRVRDGHDLKHAYLTGISFVTALIWPGLLTIVVFAHPMVRLLLGSQWDSAAPIVQIIAAAYMIWFPMNLTNPTLITAGAIREAFLLPLVTVPISIGVQAYASLHGLEAMAASLLITIPIYVLASVLVVRLRVPFAWRELGASLRGSFIVTLCLAAPYAGIALASGGLERIAIPTMLGGGVCGLLAWLLGLRLTAHPLLPEITALTSNWTRKVSARLPRRIWTPSVVPAAREVAGHGSQDVACSPVTARIAHERGAAS